MPHYDYKKDNIKKTYSSRYQSCFSNIYYNMSDVVYLSVLAFPHGGLNTDKTLGADVFYGPIHFESYLAGPILKKYDTPEMTGVERWAEFMGSFVPGSSFVLEYNEIKPIFKGVPTCEFRLECPKESNLSPIMKQIWLCGIRYSWEKSLTQFADFCLHYYVPTMEPHEAFQLFLMAHEISNGHGHSLIAQNPKFFDKESYEKLFTHEDINYTTSFLSKGSHKRKYNDYNIIGGEMFKAVRTVSTSLTENNNDVQSYQSILDLWEK